MARLEFNNIKDFEEFSKYYWYRDELIKICKAVKENGDESFTLGDLLDVYYGKKSYAVYDRSALQWNKFVKDFCEDEATKVYNERLKATVALWKLVRDSDMKKEYSRELLDKYKHILG